MGSSGLPYGLQSMLKDGHKHLSGLDEAVIKNIDACKQLSKITRTSLGPNGAPARRRCLGAHASVQRTLRPLQLSLATPLAVHCRGRPAAAVCPLATLNCRLPPPSAGLAACCRQRKPLRRRSRAGLAQRAEAARTARWRAGMNKMVINHLDKLFVTSDAATIVKELEVAHPAAKLVVLAAQAQEAEIGDGTNLVRASRLRSRRALRLTLLRPQVISLAGELLNFAEELIRDGLHPSEILEGYKKASVKVR